MLKLKHLFLPILILIVILIISLYSLFSLITAPAPENIRVTDIGPQSFSVSWTTSKPTVGCAVAQVSKGKFKVKQCSPKGTTHLVALTGFWPENTYNLKIQSGLKTFRNLLPTVTTLSDNSSQPNPPLPAYGLVLHLDNKLPAVNTLVYVSDPNNETTPILAAITNYQGGYSVDLSAFNPLPPNLNIEVVTNKVNTQNQLSTTSFSPFPNLLITQNE